MASLVAEELIGGRFKVERSLGAGGMGRVVAARNIELDQVFAIKVLHPDVRGDESRRARLIREARAAAKIRSDHAVRVFDVVGQGPDAPFIVMEYLHGESLQQMLARRGKLPLSEVIDIVAQVAEAVGEGHRLGIVHRDLKPGNIFSVTRSASRPFFKVLDYGISKAAGPGEESLTASQQVLGSPAYAAPEQLRASKDAGPQADIWSLGVLMYECLAGARPFVGDTLAELCVHILERRPPPLSQCGVDVPADIDALVQRCLAKHPASRFQSIEDLLRACASHAPEACARALAYLSAEPGTVAALERSAPESKAESSETFTATELALPQTWPTCAEAVARSRLGRGVLGTAGIVVTLGIAGSVWRAGVKGGAAPTPERAMLSAVPQPPAAQVARELAEPLASSSAPPVPAASQKPVALIPPPSPPPATRSPVSNKAKPMTPTGKAPPSPSGAAPASRPHWVEAR